MAFDTRGLDDYVDVAQRIADFRARHPEGCLQPLNPAAPFEIREIGGTSKDGHEFTATFVVYVAAAYRAPDDPRPGIGMAWEVFPGRTSFTLGSELMNAETSAWGRAIIAVLASDSKRGVASREEMRNRAAEHDDAPAVPDPGPAQSRQRPPSRPKADPVRTKTTGADHERLRHGTVEATPGDRPAQRSKLPIKDDAWDGQPSGPGMDGGGKAGLIIAHFKRLEVTDREERLGLTAKLAGWPPGKTLNSTNDLSAFQAGAVLGQLAKLKNHEALTALVTKGEKQDA